MIFKQFHLESLGHASYMVGDAGTGKALILDPRRDVDVYFEAARNEGLRIAYALDSHGHNDYLSGRTELKARDQGIEILAYAEGGYRYEHTPIKEGDRIEIGDVTVEVMHTPGHTPEHISLIVYDKDTGGDQPALFLSGGAVLVGDLARPDLLGGEGEARDAAKEYCHTIQDKLLLLPEHLEVFPTHVAGSLCGGNIGSRLSTTLGYERKTNAILARVSSSDEFVEECIRLDNLPAVPPYWKRMRKQNMEGPEPLGVLQEPPALTPDGFEAVMNGGAIVVDARSAEAYGGAHIPGSLNVGLGSSFSTWAGTIIPDGARVLLVLDRPGDLWEATWQLLRIGYDLPVGWLSGGLFAWRTAAKPLETTPQITVHDLKDRLDEFLVLDVRQPNEWVAGHIRDAQFITGAELPDRLDEVPKDRPVAVVCGSGYRSSASGSLLKHRGYDNVINVIGGMGAWNSARYETEEEGV